MKFSNKIIIIFFCVVLIGCSDGLDKETTTRIEILYEHTILMEEYSEPGQLERLGLDMTQMSKDNSISAEKMIIEMEKAYGIELEGDAKYKITELELRMDEMMSNWLVE